MPSSPSPARAPRPPPKPQMPSSPRRTQSYSPRKAPAHPPPPRRHTTYTPASSPRRSPPAAQSPSSRRRTSSTPVRGGQHVLIPVPIRAKDAESPMYVRAPSGQRVDFVFPEPKKRGIIGRLLDSVEWGGPGENKPFRYRKPGPKPTGAERPFYKKLLS